MKDIPLTRAQVEDFRTWADRNPHGVPLIREEVLEAVSEQQRAQMIDRVLSTGTANG